jgi:hypothetical protein
MSTVTSSSTFAGPKARATWSDQLVSSWSPPAGGFLDLQRVVLDVDGDGHLGGKLAQGHHAANLFEPILLA